MAENNNDDNVTVMFPEGLTKRIKRLQERMGMDSAGEVLVKALSLLEISVGRTIEVKDKNASHRWEIDEFRKFEKITKISTEDKNGDSSN